MVEQARLPDFSIWEKLDARKAAIAFDLEVTARCNLNCRHCYINLPAGDRVARDKELSVQEIDRIAQEAASLGALWCLVTGGEPLLREDFFEIYLALKRRGLLLLLFTNATAVTPEHVRLFKNYPPRDIEVTVYGVTRETYERVTRRPGSFAGFMQGLDLLFSSGLKVRLKAMALRSNAHEQDEIARFCRERTKDYFRFDPLLHLRYDGDPIRNEEIRQERLSPEEIAALDSSDPERFETLLRRCPPPDAVPNRGDPSHRLFHCGTGTVNFSVSYDGRFRLCADLWSPDCLYDLRQGSVAAAWQHFTPRVQQMRSERKEFLETCSVCPIAKLCLWCPAHAHLETGELDAPVDYFCRVAHARAAALAGDGSKQA